MRLESLSKIYHDRMYAYNHTLRPKIQTDHIKNYQPSTYVYLSDEAYRLHKLHIEGKS
jgi:hypothetical protein